MVKITGQMKTWVGDFGKEYTDRTVANSFNDLNKQCKKLYGIARSELNNLFIGKLDRNIKILEVGSNAGNQLMLLKKMGFKNLYGIEINKYAIELAKSKLKDINIIHGSAFDIPFKDKYFDLVCTTGLLIHIDPKSIKLVLKEIYRCSKKYIFGLESHDEKYTEIPYRGRRNLYWRADFVRLFTKSFPGLKVEKHKLLKFVEKKDIQDIMFLLKK